jgi:hypothetical protein
MHQLELLMLLDMLKDFDMFYSDPKSASKPAAEP